MRKTLAFLLLLSAACLIPRPAKAQVALQFRDGSGTILATYPSGGCVGISCVTVIFKEDSGPSITFNPTSNTVVVSAASFGTLYYQHVQQAGTPVTQEPTLNVLAPVTATDDPGNSSTDIAVPNCAEGSSHTSGLVPDPGSTPGSTKFLREDCTFAVPATTQQIGGAAVKTTNYTTSSGDSGIDQVFNCASACTLTLPSSIPSSGWFIPIKNIGAGVLTVNPNGLSISGRSASQKLVTGEGEFIFNDGSNYQVSSDRPRDIIVYVPGVGSNSQIVLHAAMPRSVIFPASAPNSFGVATVAATGSTTYTFKHSGSSFATCVFSASGTTCAYTQASDQVFAPGDVLEIDGPSTADATLANFSFTLVGFGF